MKEIMDNKLLTIGAISAGFTVIFGAFGSHALSNILTENGYTEVFKTGVLYQMFHSLGILITGILSTKHKKSLTSWSGYLFLSGIILFSGSLYVLSLSGLKFLGAITPLGGICFIAGWILLTIHFIKSA
ncbi:MAG: uncharacterized membrane protein YgdD (TMEM256/DUF423 family) [Marinoscillum sp.]